SQAFFIVIVFALNYKGDNVDLNKLTIHFDCNPIQILEYNDDFEYLCKKGIFKKQKFSHRLNLAAANDHFSIHEKITEAILQNLPMPETLGREINGIVDLLEKLHELFLLRSDREISDFDLFFDAGD